MRKPLLFSIILHGNSTVNSILKSDLQNSTIFIPLFFVPPKLTDDQSENIKHCLISQRLRSVHRIQMNLNTISPHTMGIYRQATPDRMA